MGSVMNVKSFKRMNNKIGMNYQMSMEEQFLDYNDLRIKNIIKPYEEKNKN